MGIILYPESEVNELRAEIERLRNKLQMIYNSRPFNCPYCAPYHICTRSEKNCDECWVEFCEVEAHQGEGK